ncbi:MAG TPA: helix-turn-helix transcriptional regulator [Candidatus Acidoferrales bacterium]|nr:helix-turn-helix transcriptional regulator [Candidatus Acidoferrales bacterium]
MERAGLKLRQRRERLKLTYRDVERASQEVAARRGNDEFSIALSRLADIENKGTVPTIYRLYTLCAIYRLDFHEALRWYGIPIDLLASESLQIPLNETHVVESDAHGLVPVPLPMDATIELSQTTFLSQVIRRWGKNGLSFLSGWDLRQHRFGLIGASDWTMHPVLHPGALVLIDQGRRRIAAGGWTSELERPIYFLEHRGGYRCGWCAQRNGALIVQPHPSSLSPPEIFAAAEVDVIGQVAGVAMLWEPKPTTPARSGSGPAKFPNP